MGIASPYAVFRAAEGSWPPRPLEPAVTLVLSRAVGAAQAPRGGSQRVKKASPSWPAVVQGELFQLA